MANPEVRDCNVLVKKELLPLVNSKSKDRTTEKVQSLGNSKSKGNFVGKELPSLGNSKSKQRTTPKVQPLGNSKGNFCYLQETEPFQYFYLASCYLQEVVALPFFSKTLHFRVCHLSTRRNTACKTTRHAIKRVFFD